ncbi:putative CRISPR-associated protein Csc2 [Enterococcus faecalis R508]|uniref:WxL domain-containing protein n=2 Tax=Enterococcus faecalis TaxID=1351 RepID=UPI00027C6EEE|nr:WxL domain-containing protein [Enterococcus faecalis]EJV37604.1 putative CRISPR-associated protein Csc2 [Enterococcus faecalis R508]RTK55936.1 WxL domain-containing protein [Enterococcus faecalis]
MKRNKWQRLAAIGLCSSLLVNAFSGVTAVAETVTIESSPTAESSVKEETQASSETQETTTGTSREEVTQKTEKQAEVAAEKKEDTPVKAEQKEVEAQQEAQPTPQLPVEIQNRAVGVKAGNLPELHQQLVDLLYARYGSLGQLLGYQTDPIPFPEGVIGFNLKNTENVTLNMADFDLTATTRFTINEYSPYKPISSVVGPTTVNKSATGFDLVVPAKTITATSNLNQFYHVEAVSLQVPAYIKQVSIAGSIVNIGYGTLEPRLTNVALIIAPTDSSHYDISSNFALGKYIYQIRDTSGKAESPTSYYATHGEAYVPANDIDLNVTFRKVTENFVDATGAKITPPTGFTQGQQTSITSNDFTYTSAKTLPDTYKAGSKTYKFKGWYKGKTKPATLKTTKTPSYAVTYDDNDDMTAVYEEVVTKTYNLPAKDVYFGYVDEAGNLLNPADFTVEAELGESTATESSVLGKVQGTNQVTSKLKKLSIPGKSYDFPVAEIKTYGTRYVDHTIPKRYKTMSISPTATYTGDKTKYPVPDGLRQNIDNPTITVTTPGTSSYKLSTNGIVFGTDRKYWTWDTNKTWYAMGIYSGVVGWNYNLLTPTGTIYYYLENRRITENFVDSNGTKITPPTGFTQGKQTVIDSDNFTYTSAKALPASYTVGDKNYKFKGWYKGTDQTALKTTKTPSYTVTYDGKDDMTAVYEEVQDTTVYPGFYAEFFDEQGKVFTNPLTLSGNYTEYLRKIDNSPFEATGSLYPMVGSKDATVANRYKVETKQSVSIPNNFFEDYPADILHKGFALNNFDITNELKYVDQVEATTKTITLYDYDTISDIGTNLLSDSVTASLNSFETVFNREVNNTFSVKAKWGQPGIARETIPNLLALGSISSKPRLLGFDGTSDYKQTINYKVTRKQVTENFVDAAGVKISAPTGFTQGKQTPMTSNSFKYTAAKALPASYSAGGKTYTFQGWYKGKTKPNTLTTSTTPTYNTTFDGNDDMTAVYKEEVPKASVTLTRTTAETVTSGGNVTWRATITNTSQAPLTTATIKKSTAWTTGLAAPTAMIVTPVGGTAKTVPVTATTWTNGVSLGTDIPVGKSATVQFTTKATGIAGQVLRAGITTSGNYSGISASATVRVKDNDQAIVTPTTEGFISVPTFNFGQIGIAGNTQQHGLKKAADYYGNGTRNPYLRIKKTQPNWSLTAQLSQPKSATDSLPTATRLLLGAAPVSSFSNYNQPTELKNTIGTTKVINLTANNTATNIVANQQFTGSNVYQLDFVFDNIKLEVPASQGMTGQQYQAAVTWNLVTGP